MQEERRKGKKEGKKGDRKEEQKRKDRWTQGLSSYVKYYICSEYIKSQAVVVSNQYMLLLKNIHYMYICIYENEKILENKIDTNLCRQHLRLKGQEQRTTASHLLFF